MKITCPACSASYNIDSSRVSANGMSMRCPKCSHNFHVSPDGSTSGAEPAVGGSTILDGGGVAIQNERYYVKRPTGKVFGPFDTNAIQMMLKSGKLGNDAEVSVDKTDWSPIASIPEFASHVLGEQNLPSFENMDPKATMMGGWTEREANLPMSKPAGLPELPALKGGADLPGLKGGFDLPALKGGADLPGLKGGADLPGLKGGADLPGLKGGADLPGLKGGADLPGIKGGFDLPALKGGADLPGIKGSDLPGLKGSDLPGLKGAPQLPALKPAVAPAPSADDLFGGGGNDDDDLFGGSAAVAKGDDDLFGAPAAKPAPPKPSLPKPPVPLAKADDDLFGGSTPASAGDDDLFGGDKNDDDDLFGGSKKGGDDDLFGSPKAKPQKADDDLFGPPVAQAKAPQNENDLFGSARDKEDVFASNRAGKTDDDDFLGGDAGFSFLNDGPPAADEPSDAWGGDLFGNSLGAEKSAPSVTGNAAGAKPAAPGAASLDDWGDDLIDRAPKTKAKPKTVNLDDSAGDPFRPMSSGIREPAPQPVQSAHVGQAQVADEDRKRGPVMAVAGVVAALLLGGGGYAIYSMFGGTETTTETTTVVKQGPVQIDLASLAPDNFSDLSTLIDKARKGQLEGDNAAKLLIVESMFLTRYKDEEVLKDATKRAETFKSATGGWNALARGAFEAQAGNSDAARAYLEPLLSGDGEQVYLANLLMGVADVISLTKSIEEGAVKLTAKKDAVVLAGTDAGTDTDAGPAAIEADAGSADAGSTDAGIEADAGAADPAAVAEAPSVSNNPIAARGLISLKGAADANPKSPLPDYWQGRMVALWDPPTAEGHLKSAITKSPTHVASHVELASLLYSRGELKDALAQVDKVNGEMAPSASSNERSEALHISGQVYVAQRQSDEAIDAFTRALKVDPTRTETLRALALEYESAKKYKEALNFFTTNKNLGQREPEVMLGIVRSHIGLEQWGAAIDQLEEAQKLFANDARFPFYLGRLNHDRGDFSQAKKAFERAVEIDPKLLTAQTSLAQLSWRMDKDLMKAESHIQKVVQNSDLIDAEVALEVARFYHQSERRPLAAQWYRESLRLDPNFWEARLALAKLQLEENKYPEARTLLEKARAEGVQDVRLAAYLADAYRQSGDYDRAIDEINKVIEQFPKSQEYIFIRGRIHFDRGNFDTALKDFSKAYDIDPRYHDAYFYVGRTAFEQGDTQQALKIFRHVLDYQPNRGSYRFFMGRALELSGRESQALDEYRKATAVDPGYGVENPRVYIYRGRLLSKLGYAPEGRKDIATALELAPDMVDALLAMGETSYNDKNYDKAITNLEKALERQPEHSGAQYMLGMSLIYAGQQREGAQRLQLAVKQGYDNYDVYRTLGYLYKELGQRSLAIESFEKYLQATKDKDVPISTRKELLRQIQELGG